MGPVIEEVQEQETAPAPDKGNYAWAILGLLGGLIAYFRLRRRDESLAGKVLAAGAGMSLLYAVFSIVLWMLAAHQLNNALNNLAPPPPITDSYGNSQPIAADQGRQLDPNAQACLDNERFCPAVALSPLNFNEVEDVEQVKTWLNDMLHHAYCDPNPAYVTAMFGHSDYGFQAVYGSEMRDGIATGIAPCRDEIVTDMQVAKTVDSWGHDDTRLDKGVFTVVMPDPDGSFQDREFVIWFNTEGEITNLFSM